jgi:hypothetical protein
MTFTRHHRLALGVLALGLSLFSGRAAHAQDDVTNRFIDGHINGADQVAATANNDFYTELAKAGIAVPTLKFEKVNEGKADSPRYVTARLTVSATDVVSYDPTNPTPSARFNAKTVADLDAIEKALVAADIAIDNTRRYDAKGPDLHHGFNLLIQKDGSVLVQLTKEGSVSDNWGDLHGYRGPGGPTPAERAAQRSTNDQQLDGAKKMAYISSVVLPKIDEVTKKPLDDATRDKVASAILAGDTAAKALSASKITLSADQTVELNQGLVGLPGFDAASLVKAGKVDLRGPRTPDTKGLTGLLDERVKDGAHPEVKDTDR